MQTLRKKTSPCKYKNEPSKFLGEGVTFKAKLIGILEVEEARGDRMCQEALFELKMAIRAAGEHKQRINIVIAIDGVRLRDEKSGDCLHHHPVHKISFIAQDVADSRAFGYIYGSPDTSHRFFGIKTDKAASQVVVTMRDLFQAVYELKKREVELAKQNIEQHQLKYGSSYFMDSLSASATKPIGTDQMTRLKQITNKEEPNKSTSKNKPQTSSVIADLMDLELELSSLQQGLSQMERLTPSDPFGPSPSTAQEDPFGDSFTPPPCISTPPPAKLPPPPVSTDRRKMIGSTSSAPSQSPHWFDKESHGLYSDDKMLTGSNEYRSKTGHSNHFKKSAGGSKDLYDIFTELDPLGTGRSKPYTDKKDFFQELKNPPKRQLKDLNHSTTYAGISTNTMYSKEADRYEDRKLKYRSIDSNQLVTLSEEYNKPRRNLDSVDAIESGFTSFVPSDSSSVPVLQRSPSSHQPSPTPDNLPSHASLHTALKSSSNSSRSIIYKSILTGEDMDSPSVSSHQSSPQWTRPQEEMSKQKIVINLHRVLSNVDDTENDSPVGEEPMLPKPRDNSSPGARGEMSSDSFESLPEPPPRIINSPLSNISRLRHTKHIPPCPTDSVTNYDHIPPLPVPSPKPKFQQDYDKGFARYRPHKYQLASEPDYNLKSFPPSSKSSLYMTISQLTSTGFDELAAMLKIPSFILSKMTLKELTVCLSRLSDVDCQKVEADTNRKVSVEEFRGNFSVQNSFEDESTLTTFKTNFEDNFPSTTSSAPAQVDKYAVFRELIDQEETIRSTPNNDKTENEEDGAKSSEESGETEKELPEQKTEKACGYVTLRTTSDEKENEGEDIEADDADLKTEAVQKKYEEDSAAIEEPALELFKQEQTKELQVETNFVQVGKNWAKFDSEQDPHSKSLPLQEENNEGRSGNQIKYTEESTPRKWRDEDLEVEDQEAEEAEERNFLNDPEDDYDDDSEENWDSSKSAVSSWDESSWKENGWSDRDSLYEDTELAPPRYCDKYPAHQGGKPKYSPNRRPEGSDEESLYWKKEHSRRSRPAKPGSRPRHSNAKEENELTFLKMMLGKKRLKALEEQLFQHYHEKLNKKVASTCSKKHSRSHTKSTSSASLLLQNQPAEYSKRRSAKKYYATCQPRSADKSSKASPSRQEDTAECYKPFRRPCASEEERWNSSKWSNIFKKGSSSRSRSQSSPFEDNFMASANSYDSPTDNDSQKANTTPNVISSTSTTPSKMRNQCSSATAIKKLPTTNSKRKAYSYSSYDNIPQGRRNHCSSQRQSPFEDDFTPDSQKPYETGTDYTHCAHSVRLHQN